MYLRLTVVIILIASGIWLFQRPPIEAPTASSAVSTELVTKVAPSPRPVAVKQRAQAELPKIEASETKSESVADAGVDVVDAAIQPRGPFFIPFGQHTVYLRDPVFKRRIRLSLTGEARTAAGQAQVKRSKQRLIRMLFFLASRRHPDAAERADAANRLQNDLYDRFSKIVPGNALIGLSIDEYEVIRSAPREDAGPTP